MTQVEQDLRERYLQAMIEATFPLQEEVPDREVALCALIDAAAQLKERFEHELEELRQEAD